MVSVFPPSLLSVLRFHLNLPYVFFFHFQKGKNTPSSLSCQTNYTSLIYLLCKFLALLIFWEVFLYFTFPRILVIIPIRVTLPVRIKFRILPVYIGKRCINKTSAALSLITLTFSNSMVRIWRDEIYHLSSWKHYFLSYPFPFTVCLGMSSPVTRIYIHLT